MSFDSLRCAWVVQMEVNELRFMLSQCMTASAPVKGLGVGFPVVVGAAITRSSRSAVRMRGSPCFPLVVCPAIWLPPVENEEARQLLLHRSRLVQLHTRMPWPGTRACSARVYGGRSAVSRWKLCLSGDGARSVARICWDCWMNSTAGSNRSTRRSKKRRGKYRRTTADDPSRRRTDRSSGLGARHRRLAAVSARQVRGQLPGSDSPGSFRRRQATPGAHQQARQQTGALPACRGRQHSPAARPKLASAVRAPVDEQTSRRNQR